MLTEPLYWGTHVFWKQGCNTSPHSTQSEIWKICILLCVWCSNIQWSIIVTWAFMPPQVYITKYLQLLNSNGRYFSPFCRINFIHRGLYTIVHIRYVIIQYNSYKRQEISIMLCRNCCMHAKRLLGRLLSELRLCAMCC